MIRGQLEAMNASVLRKLIVRAIICRTDFQLSKCRTGSDGYIEDAVTCQ